MDKFSISEVFADVLSFSNAAKCVCKPSASEFCFASFSFEAISLLNCYSAATMSFLSASI